MDGDKWFFWCGLRGGLEILCRKQVDHLDASGEAAELDVDGGVGQGEDGFIELHPQGSRGFAERYQLEQVGCGADPVGGVMHEGAHGNDEGVGWRRGVEGLLHFVGCAVEGGGGGLGPGEGGGVAGGA